MYILAVDVSVVQKGTERTIWRFYDAEDLAMDKWYRVRAYFESGERARDGADIIQVEAARLYVTSVVERGPAREAVLAGLPPIKDTHNSLAGQSEEESSLESLLGPPD
jgi:hypothetical protein